MLDDARGDLGIAGKAGLRHDAVLLRQGEAALQNGRGIVQPSYPDQHPCVADEDAGDGALVVIRRLRRVVLFDRPLEERGAFEVAAAVLEEAVDDVPRVGGKNASLGEMIVNLGNLGVSVPGGFATTANAFDAFLAEAGIDEKIQQRLKSLDTNDVRALASAGKEIRQWITDSPLPAAFEQDIGDAYQAMATDGIDATVAVRSSATAEDLPDASFAGQQETYLNIKGIEQILHAVKLVFASLYNDRAISYRVHQGFAHDDVSLSAGVQRMVRSDLASSGVMFSIDTESGFGDVVFITSSYGLGETVVQGAVNPAV